MLVIRVFTVIMMKDLICVLFFKGGTGYREICCRMVMQKLLLEIAITVHISGTLCALSVFQFFITEKCLFFLTCMGCCFSTVLSWFLWATPFLPENDWTLNL